jgi:hypothetical protein
MTYTPGFKRCKALLVLAGIALFLFGAEQAWPVVRLVLMGRRAQAETVWVVKEKQGLPPVILKTDPEIDSHREPHDRSYVFWNVFKFTTADGRTITVRAGAGSQLGPLRPMLDEDGLPSALPVYYDPARPEHAAFPTLVSTWLTAAVFLLAGILAVIIGAILFYWADVPIDLPHLEKNL